MISVYVCEEYERWLLVWCKFEQESGLETRPGVGIRSVSRFKGGCMLLQVGDLRLSQLPRSLGKTCMHGTPGTRSTLSGRL